MKGGEGIGRVEKEDEGWRRNIKDG